MSAFTDDEIEAYKAALRQWSALAGDHYQSLKDAGLPEALAGELIRDWYADLDYRGDDGGEVE